MEKKKSKVLSKGQELTNEFKTFALSGATLGAAVGIMLGAALNTVISSLVKDVLTPPIAYLTSGRDFANLYLALSTQKFNSLSEAQTANVPIIFYGNFLNALFAFLITALVLFFLIRGVSKLMIKEDKKA